MFLNVIFNVVLNHAYIWLSSETLNTNFTRPIQITYKTKLLTFVFVSHFLNSFLYSIIMYNLYLTESDIVINYNFNVLTYGCSHLYICLLNALYMKPFRCCCLIIGRQQGLVTFFIDISTYSSWQGLTYNWVGFNINSQNESIYSIKSH